MHGEAPAILSPSSSFLRMPLIHYPSLLRPPRHPVLKQQYNVLLLLCVRCRGEKEESFSFTVLIFWQSAVHSGAGGIWGCTAAEARSASADPKENLIFILKLQSATFHLEEK